MPAKVILQGCLSKETQGRRFERGKPQVVTNEDEIEYFQMNEDFVVTSIEEERVPAKAPASAAKMDGVDAIKDEVVDEKEVRDNRKGRTSKKSGKR